MAIYSHSKLSAFEQCKYKYKLKYIDKIPSPVKRTIEAHLGSSVHSALEWLYKGVIEGKIPSIDELIQKYTEFWQKDYSDKFLIVRKELKPKDYFNKGVKFLIDYYLKHEPFDEGTVEVEKKIWINLNEEQKIVGYIDRLSYNSEKNEYEIHDYKTSGFLPGREKFEKDRQLALYSIAIKDTYGKEKPVILTWHYLNHNEEIVSRRTNEQLEELKEEIKRLIEKIEKTTDFPTNKTPLCEWCEYKTYCKAWGNSIPPEFQKEKNIQEENKEYEREGKTLEEIKKEFPGLSKYLKE